MNTGEVVLNTVLDATLVRDRLQLNLVSHGDSDKMVMVMAMVMVIMIPFQEIDVTLQKVHQVPDDENLG